MKHNSITDFLNKYFANEKIKQGFVLRTDFTIDIIEDDTPLTLENMQRAVDGYIEIVHYITDDNFEVVVDEEGLVKDKRVNFLALDMTDVALRGDVLIVRKGVIT